MQRIATGLIAFVGLANMLPSLGMISASRLTTMYGVALDDSSLVILMRHRAVLFLLVGGFVLLSAFRRELRPPAYVMGFVSMVSFVLIALLVGDYNAELTRVFWADVVGTVLLAAAWVLQRSAERSVA